MMLHRKNGSALQTNPSNSSMNAARRALISTSSKQHTEISDDFSVSSLAKNWRSKSLWLLQSSKAAALKDLVKKKKQPTCALCSYVFAYSQKAMTAATVNASKLAPGVKKNIFSFHNCKSTIPANHDVENYFQVA